MYLCDLWRISFILNIEHSCEKFDGIGVPKATEVQVCCAIGCGKCGGPDCGDRPGGKKECCASAIPTTQICGKEGQKAPCYLKQIQKEGKIM